MKISRSERFARRVQKRLSSDEQRALARALRLFSVDPRDPRLGTHKLTGRHEDKWAFGFGYDARVIFSWESDHVVLLDVGAPDEVYG